MLVVFSAPVQARSLPPDDSVIAARSKASGPVPLPRPRPSETGQTDTAPAAPDGEAAPAASNRPAAPSACRLALTDAVAIAPSIPPVKGPGACGGDDLVRLEAVVLSDKRRVAVKPAAILRCRMASAVAQWVREDVAPLAAGLGTTVNELDNFDSFECRGRNRVVGAKLSEHGRANALDVRGVKLANGRMLSLTDRNAPHDAREKARASVCARFTTVLGPGSDGYHEDHIHLDLAERRNGYRICHWDVHDGATEIATPLPPPRPQQAPPRELASRDDGNASVQAEDAKQVEDVKVQPAPPPPALSLSPVPLARQPANVAKPATKPSPNVRRAAREGATQPMQIVPDAKPVNDPPPSTRHAKRRKTARAKTRRSEPDLPRVLRKMFE